MKLITKNKTNISYQLKFPLLSQIETENIIYYLKCYEKINKSDKIVVYEPIDKFWNRLNIKNYLEKIKKINIDILVCNSLHMEKFFTQKQTCVVYHHYDDRLSRGKIVNEVIYCGIKEKSSFTEKNFSDYNIKHVDFKYLKNSSIHITYITKDNLYYHIHTSTKLATSVATGSIFISNKIPVFVELLGEDYPYFFKDDLSDIKNILKKCEKTLTTRKLYEKYCNNLEKIVKKLSPNNILKDYIKGLNIKMKRTDVINYAIKKYKYIKYLEIGVRKTSDNFDKINVKEKIGVDPNFSKNNKNIIKMTSDSFFKINSENFDIIFIDGLHLEEQVDKDIVNSLNVLNEGGVIILHDCNPPSEFHQRKNYEVDGKFPSWNGTVWRSIAKLRMTRTDLKINVLDTDWGLGIIKKSFNEPLYEKHEDFDYDLLHRDRKNLLNLENIERLDYVV